MEASKIFTVAEIDLVYRTTFPASSRPVVKSSDNSYQIFLESWDKDKLNFVEQFKVLLLNKANHVLALYETSTGGTDATVVDVKLIMIAALKVNAKAMVLAHNHPSESLKPSETDLKLTAKLVNAGALLDISILDHIIVTPFGYYSFADNGNI